MPVEGFLVVLRLPKGASATDAVEYIRNAVISERGLRHPRDPMFHLDPGSVRVVRAAAFAIPSEEPHP